jgi:hypothetical protein
VVRRSRLRVVARQGNTVHRFYLSIVARHTHSCPDLLALYRSYPYTTLWSKIDTTHLGFKIPAKRDLHRISLRPEPDISK